MGDSRCWTVVWSASAVWAVSRLPLKVVDAVVAFSEGPLTRDPYRVSKPLREQFAGKRSACRGSYRVLAEIDDGSAQVRIHDVVHRADAYRPR